MRMRGAEMTGAVGTAAVMGAGAWGTALAKVLADAGNEVRLWARNTDVAREVNDAHTNTPYLPPQHILHTREQV